MESLKAIVDSLNIPEKKKAFNKRNAIILNIKYSMSQLALNNMVARYAYNLDTISYGNDEMIIKNAALANAILLKREPEVQAYESLRRELVKLEEQSSEYYKSIQLDLRDALLDQKLPDIYVYQGLLGTDNMKLCRHIIIPGRYQTYDEPSEVGTIIYPAKEKESNRKLRHFYSNVSFKYLDSLVDDGSYDLEGKRLGRVLIKK